MVIDCWEAQNPCGFCSWCHPDYCGICQSIECMDKIGHEDHQNYFGNLLESTRFFLYLVGSLDEDQSVEILFNLMFFLKGEHRTESKSGKRSETKISYNERVVFPKETKENSL